jgi:hypothetical protein
LFGNNAGFYYGLAGIAFGLRATGPQLPGAPRYNTAVSMLEERVLSVAPFAPEAAALWNNTDVHVVHTYIIQVMVLQRVHIHETDIDNAVLLISLFSGSIESEG